MINRYTFWKLLSEKKIVIPIIQRDYAQGREDKAYIRKNFLTQLGRSLFNGENTELDFIYGTEYRIKTTEEGETVVMHPLDGQQRLTTLWLMHWYVAYKSGILAQPVVKETLERFSYETRTSSREFCEKLCSLTMPQSEGENIADTVRRQSWFFSVWKQDPTITSMLRMLSGTDNSDGKNSDFVDGVEELFPNDSDFQNIWNKLTGEDCPIHFNFLPLSSSELPVSDDLYIKMNARGKALTSFENFKADLVKWVYSEENKEKKEAFGKTTEERNRRRAEFTSLFDNSWTDIFWESGKEYKRIDELYFAFINRYLLNHLILNYKNPKTGKMYVDDFFLRQDRTDSTGKKTQPRPLLFDHLYGAIYFGDVRRDGDDRRIAYSDFAVYEELLSFDVLENLQKIFENMRPPSEMSSLFPSWLNEDMKDFFIPSYTGKDIVDFHKTVIKEISPISLKQRVVFYGICQYLQKAGSFEADSFKHWMRVVWNIAENTNENSSTQGYIRTLRIIDRLSEGCKDIYKLLDTKEFLTHSTPQVKEEAAKAHQINLKNASPETIGPNEDEIVDAENCAFFHGAIAFLYRDQEGKTDWKDFQTKYYHAKKLFDASGLRDSCWPDTNKVLLSYCDKWDGQLSKKTIFGCKAPNWLTILKSDDYKAPVHFLLTKGTIDSSHAGEYADVVDELIKEDVIWQMIKRSDSMEDYVLAWHSGAPCIWLKRYLYWTVRLRSKGIDEIMGELIDKKIIEPTGNPEDYYLTGKSGKKYFRCSPEISFSYHNHVFASNGWGWIDMYENNEKLWDRGKRLEEAGQKDLGAKYQSLHTYYSTNMESGNVPQFDSANKLISQLDACINKYNEITTLEKETEG